MATNRAQIALKSPPAYTRDLKSQLGCDSIKKGDKIYAKIVCLNCRDIKPRTNCHVRFSGLMKVVCSQELREIMFTENLLKILGRIGRW